MDASLIVEIGTGVGALITGFSVIGSLFYLHNQNRNERILSDERWAALMTKTDDRFQKSDDRFQKSDDRWAALLESFCEFKNVNTTHLNKLESFKAQKNK